LRWIVFGVSATLMAGALSPAQAVYRAFPDRSYWNRPLPKDAPRHPDSAQMIRYLREHNDTNYIRLGGATETGEWGMPIYWPRRSAPVYDVGKNCPTDQPAEFNRVRIPRGARPDPTSDAAMTIVDRIRGVAYGFHRARYDRDHDRWTACGGTVYYLDSNGLHGDLRASDDERNRGHRGIPPTTMAVRYDEIVAGRIPHMLKIAVSATACRHVFPMIENECGTTHRYAPPEGTRIRIKPGFDLERLHLSPGAMVIARALKRYGAIIGDQSGGPVVLKLENTIAERRGFLWEGLLTPTSLEKIPLGAFQVIAPGYRP
jgi:hypothetical protein